MTSIFLLAFLSFSSPAKAAAPLPFGRAHCVVPVGGNWGDIDLTMTLAGDESLVVVKRSPDGSLQRALLSWNGSAFMTDSSAVAPYNFIRPSNFELAGRTLYFVHTQSRCIPGNSGPGDTQGNGAFCPGGFERHVVKTPCESFTP